MSCPARGHHGEGGYALLALLASSAMLLAGLALSLPRMAMQAQRVREERLIERGEQYRRAIELYYREHNKYPEELEDLEDTDGVRYLRRRYPEPMGETGEWRIIHMGRDGRFEDSLLHDRAKPGQEQGQGIEPLGAVGAGLAGVTVGSMPPSQSGPGPPGLAGFDDPRTAGGPQPLVGAARARAARASAAPDLAARDRYSQGFEFDASQAPGALQEGGDVPGEPPDYSRMLPSTVPMNENDPRRASPYGVVGQPGQGTGPRGTLAGLPGTGGDAARGARDPGPAPASQFPGNPAGLAAGSGAAEMINQLLTSPRPGGLEGQSAMQAPAASAPVFERGIAGVASQGENLGVKVYGGKEAYNEWEFVFDYRKDSGTQAQPAGPGAQSPRRQQPMQGRTASRIGARRQNSR